MSEFKNDSITLERKHFNLINSILDIIVELSLNLTITYINPQVYDVLGYSPEELLGKMASDFIHKDDIPKIEESIKEGIKTSEIITEDFRIRHKQGNYIPVSVKGRVVEYGNQTRIVAIFRDTTKEKEAEQKLKESDRRYREIIENIEDGYFELDLQGNYTYMNDYTCRYLGVLREDLIGKNSTSILNNDTIAEVVEIFSKVYNNNLPKGTFISQVIRNDGEERTFEGTFYLKYDSSEKKIGFYGFTHDITEKIVAEKQLRKSEEKYRELYNRAELYKDLFYHDINNILSNIKLSIDISEKYLDEPDKKNEIKDLYKLIREQFGRGTKLINSVRKLSNLENLEKSLKSVRALKILNNSIKFVKNSLQTNHLNIKIESSENKIFTRANEFLIDVFDNLLINAVNYNENLKKEVLIKISRKSKKNVKYIKFEFIDNGIGISNKRKEIIFQEKFSKEKGSKGMGFGLTLVNKIIESYKGKIWVEDRVEGDYTQGSNFVILIPEAKK
jgi:PAS domain S-box-containing protein